MSFRSMFSDVDGILAMCVRFVDSAVRSFLMIALICMGRVSFLLLTTLSDFGARVNQLRKKFPTDSSVRLMTTFLASLFRYRTRK